MNEMIVETPQAGENEERVEVRLATVAEVLNDGLRLQFDGSDAATTKIYKCNASCMFTVGDRVKVTKHSGTYLVDYVIGAPGGGGGSVEDLVNGSRTVHLNSNGYLVPNTAIWLGTSSSKWGRLYTSGDAYIASGASALIELGSSTGKLGFFGTTPAVKTTVASNASVATLIAALKTYGLV